MKFLTDRVSWLLKLNSQGKINIEDSSILIRGSIGIILLRVASTGLAFVISIVIARTLGATGYGIYAYVFAWVMLLGVFEVMGLDKLLVRNISAYYTNMEWGLMAGIIHRSNQAVLISSFALALGAALTGWVLSNPAGSDTLHAFWLALVLLPIFSLIKLRQSVLQGLHRVVISQIPEMIILPILFIILIGGTYLLLNRPISTHWIILDFILSTAGSLFVLTYSFKKNFPQPARNTPPVFETYKWIRSALPLLLLDGMFVINSKTDVIMLGAMKGIEMVGIYNVANRAAELVTFVLNSVNMVLAPTVSSLYAQGDMQKLQRVITLSARAVLLFSLPIALVLIFGGEYLLLLFGQDFLRGNKALAILSVGQLVNVAMGSVGLLLIMTGHGKEAAMGVGVGAVLNIGLNALLIPRWGVEGAAVATATSMIIWNILLAAWVYKRIGIYSTALGKVNLWKRI